MSLLIALAILTVIVVIHEFGHFLAAKLLRFPVVAFGVGFGPKLLSLRLGNTFYSLGVLPLGGFVRPVLRNPAVRSDRPPMSRWLSNMMVWPNAREDALEEELRGKHTEFFCDAAPGKQLVVVLAGPAATLVGALLFCAAGAFWSPSYTWVTKAPLVGSVVEGFPAEKGGLKAEDRFLEVSGRWVKEWDDLLFAVQSSKGQPVHVAVGRPNVGLVKLEIAPRLVAYKDLIYTEPQQRYVLGFLPKRKTNTGDLRMLVKGLFDVIDGLVVDPLKALYEWVVPSAKAESIGMGSWYRKPLSQLQVLGELPEYGAYTFFFFMAWLSLLVLVVNMLPVPPMDGGLAALVVYELLGGKEKVTRRLQEMGSGLVTAITAMILALIMWEAGVKLWPGSEAGDGEGAIARDLCIKMINVLPQGNQQYVWCNGPDDVW